MNRAMRLTLVATALFAVTLLAGGCSSSKIDSSALRNDWTPELDATAMSSEQYYNKRTIHRNNLKRQIWDDWANIWFEGRNQRLTKYPMP